MNNLGAQEIGGPRAIVRIAHVVIRPCLCIHFHYIYVNSLILTFMRISCPFGRNAEKERFHRENTFRSETFACKTPFPVGTLLSQEKCPHPLVR